jgi:hypothetical protein
LDLCGQGSAAFCFDLQTSASNCGACGKQCPLGIPCESGRCRLYRCQGNVTMKVLATQSRGGVDTEMAVGDLDGDGYLDMVSGSETQQLFQFGSAASASSFLGKGDGTFATKASFPVANPTGVSGWYSAVADLNRDGVLDLVTTSPVQDSITVRQGTGDGSFLTGTDYVMGAGPAGIVLADLNADGIPDIATAGQMDSVVSLRFGIGDGTFGERTALPLVGSPYRLAYVDWNQDGIPDLIASDNFLHIFLGLGSGSFAKAVDCGLSLNHYGWSPAAVLADFDQDGRLDLAMGYGVLFGMNGCNFASRFDYPDWWPLVADDFNGDGLPDLVVTTTAMMVTNGQAVALFISGGAAGLNGPANLANIDNLGDSSTAVSGDLNGDGRLDLVVSGMGGVYVLLNTCQ